MAKGEKMKNFFNKLFKKNLKSAPEIPEDLMNRTEISREILEYYIEHNPQNNLMGKVLQLKLDELNHKTSGFDGTMTRWQLYQADIPTWTRGLSISDVWWILRTAEKLEQKGLPKERMEIAFDDNIKSKFTMMDEILTSEN